MKFLLGVNETFNTPCKKTITLPIYNTKPQKQPLTQCKMMTRNENLPPPQQQQHCRRSSSSCRT